MMTWGSLGSLGVVFVLLGTGCGGSPTNTVATKEDALKIQRAAESALAQLPGGNGEASCSGGGTIGGKVSTTGEGSSGTTKQEVTFTGCVSQGVTLDGSLLQEGQATAAGAISSTHTGHVETSLGSCVVDLKATTTFDLSAGTTKTETSGKLCGFDVP